MVNKKRAVIADDLRKIGTTSVAAGIVGIFLSDHRLLTAFALVVGVVIWITGICLTPED
ncbi:hypothetical protein H7A76_21925 [Pseudomonas sp. MSSRFD41]|uniref:DUF2892 domain-containing protein n=1 Tax=Pseudomonas sessilinigenes TaxID=658629 RepID=A0ABX8MFK1_9PSED|nr:MULTISPECIES: hypothetical protein [Pseudomonas]AZC24830.1 hypothetical protein C4K39_3156 [Pseudomonas sessilinigenes]MBC2658107.1 hypothetical protein [Pseudomonas sp. MSSRFD41]QXH37881.1 hypothetical protein KSS89_16440 [Pseudomonas sessilinigenes]UMZ10648.1 hypothetical protein I9018_24645 [Pseudomonas sp. MPFS]